MPPVAPELVTLSGRVIYSDGKPAAEKIVQFLSGAEITDASPIVLSDFEARTDQNGQFSLKILKAKAGILSASFFTIPGEYKDCPQLDEITAQSGGSVQQIKTPPIEVSGNENLSAVELKFPFPYCEEKEK